ncbi:unnamed protein product [Brassica rapa subsp. trilocularis]
MQPSNTSKPLSSQPIRSKYQPTFFNHHSWFFPSSSFLQQVLGSSDHPFPQVPTLYKLTVLAQRVP